MKRIFTFAACLFVSLLSATGAETRSAPAAVRDHLWVWGHDASFDWPAHEDGETPGKNRMTPVEGAVYLDVPNVMFIQYQGIPAAPFQQYYTPFKAMKQVYWTLSNNGNQAHELGQEQEHVYQLAADNPNITGLLLDDFLIGPFGDNEDSHWLAANNAAFPVSLVASLPQEVTADSLALTQTAWEGGGYRTAKFAVDVSRDGTNWQEVATGELPDDPGATGKLSFPEQPLGLLRVRVLSSHDTQVAMSCGLKALALFRKDQPVSLAGAQFRASSEYPGHEAVRLLLPGVVADGGAKVFTSQVGPQDLAAAKRRMQAIDGRKLDLAVVVYNRQIDPGIVPILKDVDSVLFWTWDSSDLKDLEANFRRLKELLPGKKVFLGCYLWDFCSPPHTISTDLMEHQCELGLKWLRAGEIEGMIFLGTNIMDKNLKAVEWTREWIARVGDEKLK
jgi:hypothetical protein